MVLPTGDADRRSEPFQLQQQAHANQANNCPDCVTDERADLHSQGGAEAAADALPNRLADHGTRRCVEHQAENESRDEQRQHVIAL